MILAELTNTEAMEQRFRQHGLNKSAAASKANLMALAAKNLIQAGLQKQSRAFAFFVPGRVELLGKHTDYAGGRSIVAAVEQGFCIIAVARNDSVIRVWANDLDAQAEFDLNPQLAVTQGHWTNYPKTVARRIARNFSAPLYGAEISFASDLPNAAGMSSSSAMIVAFFLALTAVNQLEKRAIYRSNIPDMLALAGYLATIENGQSFGALKGDRGVGTFGGSEDHTAILCSQSNRLHQFSYCPTRFERDIPFPPGYLFAFCASGVEAQKTGAAREMYNRASHLVTAILQIWRQEKGRNDETLAAIVNSGSNAVDELQNILRVADINTFSPNDLLIRLEHFVAESEEIIVPAGEALSNGDLALFGRFVDRSQDIAGKLLNNQVPETIFLARSARELGAVAASSFGAGFGGSVWALIREDTAQPLLREWLNRYKKEFPQTAAKASFFLSKAGPAAFQLD